MSIQRFSNKAGAAHYSMLLSIRFGLAILAAQSVVGADQPGKPTLDNFLKQSRYAAIEFKLSERNKPLVKGDLDGGKKLTFMVDTGSTMTRLNNGSTSGLKTLGELGVELDDSLLGRVSDPSIVLMKHLTLGNAQFLNQPALVEDITLDYRTIPYQGIIGADFFFRNFCIFDFYSRRLYVRGGARTLEESKAVEQTFRSSNLIDVPVRSSSHYKGWLLIEAKVNGKPVPFLVDSGSNISLVDKSQTDRLALEFIRENRPSTGSLIPESVGGLFVGAGKIGARKIRVVRFQTFEIGSGTWQKVNFAVGDLTDFGLTKERVHGEVVQGILGIDQLTAHGMLIDYSNRKLWMRPEGWKH